ncbi:MAG: phosphatase PAP2 family protein [Alphaproteobacteria bacterium]|nr:phosphatase PAP2 family protein [Alphaproteobacteria bacterium]MCB9975005.1 phosphatase PAP2 family protein [Rhodospirillales bacterium]
MTKEPQKITTAQWLMIGGLILFMPFLAVVISVLTHKPSSAPNLLEKYNIQGMSGDTLTESDSVDGDVRARYPDDRWDPKMLQILEEGPSLLSKQTELAVNLPPADDSGETKAGLDVLRRFAKTLRTPEQVALIRAENEMVYMFEPFDKAGLFLSASNKETVNLLRTAQGEVGYFVVKAKRDFARVRPDALAPDLETVVDNPKHASYPSGHATQGFMAALILALVDPAHEKQYKALGYDIGLRREIAGVHYPSDSRAGRTLAQAVLDKLLEVPEFKEQLEKARASFMAADESSFESYVPVDTRAALRDGDKE